MLKTTEGIFNFNPITFNVLKQSWRVPEADPWPREYWGMPLGYFIRRMRCGDIDAKEHWFRRPILDKIKFDWGDGLDYINFTWDKLERGLVWYVHFRGHEIESMEPHAEIGNTVVAKFGKPEEIRGLKIGYLVYSAIDQMQMLCRYYPYRFQFLKDLGFARLAQEYLVLGYKPMPHAKTNPLNDQTRVSQDGNYLKDDFDDVPISNLKP
ncbi:hypothetical protein BdWA1_003379 [Babesia duncani]|uniref:Uncharacterized protein n=1 Tax=Babesia duncani TaxID=323732 RepID=A0AAD9PI22_9APIC|nr:hypothetical protein BdWA1_003379 [Babesia duncani]